jgi:hypothetical protein
VVGNFGRLWTSKIFSGQIDRQIYEVWGLGKFCEVREVRKFGRSGGLEGLGGRKVLQDVLAGNKCIFCNFMYIVYVIFALITAEKGFSTALLLFKYILICFHDGLRRIGRALYMYFTTSCRLCMLYFH